MRAFVAALSCFILAGCAIHPLPEDVTALSTEAVVVHVRCEMRAAFRQVFKEFLSRPEHASNARVQHVLQKLARPDDPLTESDISHFDKETQALVDRYRKTGVAYNFSFNMAESNGGAASLNFLQAFTGGAGTLALSASDDRARQNIRTFTITDTPEKLLLYLDARHRRIDQYRRGGSCSEYIPYIDFRYPVTGNIGLEEAVRTFVNLSLFDSLGDKDGQTKGPPTMADELTFTTTLKGGLTPKVALLPVRHGLMDASVSASAGRTDTHKLVIGLSLPLPDEGKRSKARGQRSLDQGALITAQGSPAELNAALAVSQSILRFDLRGTTIIINGDGTVAN